MDWLKHVLINYWPQILAIVLFIASFILQLLKKKPVNDLIALIFDYAIDGINLAEKSNVKGQEKLALAVQYVFKRLAATFPDLNVESYRSIVIGIIETILTTPEKKKSYKFNEK